MQTAPRQATTNVAVADSAGSAADSAGSAAALEVVVAQVMKDFLLLLPPEVLLFLFLLLLLLPLAADYPDRGDGFPIWESRLAVGRTKPRPSGRANPLDAAWEGADAEAEDVVPPPARN